MQSCNFQANLKAIESQFKEALNSSEAKSTFGSESCSTGAASATKALESTADSLQVTKKLEEELSKRDTLIEVRYR
jgi:hypothetical protein